MIVCGIDPGFSGAIAVVNDHGDCESCDMPVIGDGPQKIINAARVAEFIRSRDAEFAIVEEVTAMPKFGCVQSFRLGGAFHSVLAVLQLCAIPYMTIRPHKWKKDMRLTPDKHLSRRRATERFPRAYQQFERAKDDGRAEAALLAVWWLEGRHEKDSRA